MKIAGVHPSRLDERAVSYALAPRMNAAGRLYRADAALELVLTEDPARAEEIAEELHAANGERRHAETRILFQAEAQIAELGDQPAYVLAGDEWHAGVVGVVASRLTDRHGRPVIMIAMDKESGKGSGRSIGSFDLLEGLHACSEHLIRYGGHRGAAGLEIECGELDRFIKAFTAHAQEHLAPEDVTQTVAVDAVMCASELDLQLAEALVELAPFGRGNPKVSLLLPAGRFRDPRAMGKGKHVRFTVTSARTRLPAVAFGIGSSLPVPEGVLTDGLFALEVDEWNGISAPRLNLLHAQPCAPDPIELIGENDPYLDRVWAELARDPAPKTKTKTKTKPSRVRSASRREVHDRRGLAIAGTVVGLVATGDPVLVLCADARLRMAQMSSTIGGFSLCSYDTLIGEGESPDATPTWCCWTRRHPAYERLALHGSPAAARPSRCGGGREVRIRASGYLERDHRPARGTGASVLPRAAGAGGCPERSWRASRRGGPTRRCRPDAGAWPACCCASSRSWGLDRDRQHSGSPSAPPSAPA